MSRYDAASTIRTARAEYFLRSGFASDGGYGARWVKLRIGRATIAFPNTAARVRSVKLHDIHHVLTEYDTSWTGEAEIASWEIASGCARHYPAWLLNFGALAVGLFLAPKRVFRAFIRGRHSRNLYRTEFEEVLLDRTVADLRAELAIPTNGSKASGDDMVTFIFWAATSVFVSLLPYAVLATLAFHVRRRLRRCPVLS